MSKFDFHNEFSLITEINSLQTELENRKFDLVMDPNGLELFGTNSRAGHCQQFYNKQKRLQDALEEFNTRGYRSKGRLQRGVNKIANDTVDLFPTTNDPGYFDDDYDCNYNDVGFGYNDYSSYMYSNYDDEEYYDEDYYGNQFGRKKNKSFKKRKNKRNNKNNYYSWY